MHAIRPVCVDLLFGYGMVQWSFCAAFADGSPCTINKLVQTASLLLLLVLLQHPFVRQDLNTTREEHGVFQTQADRCAVRCVVASYHAQTRVVFSRESHWSSLTERIAWIVPPLYLFSVHFVLYRL